MLITPHILSGMLAGGLVPQSYSIFAGFISYFFLELIPHWDPENYKKKWIIFVRYFDGVVGFLALVLVGIIKGEEIGYLLGGIAALMPYAIFSVFKLFDSQTFSRKVIRYRKKLSYTDRSFWGVVVQFAICVIALAIIFQLIKLPTSDVIQNRISF